MKTITVGFLRYNMGSMFHEIKSRKQSYLITHQGKPLAKLVPLDDTTVILSNGEIHGESILRSLPPPPQPSNAREE